MRIVNDDVSERPAHFGITFAVMLLGIPVFLLGAAILRNAVVEGPHAKRSFVDALLKSDSYLAFLGLFVLLAYYPVLARKRGLLLWPYMAFLAGSLMFFGPMLYWAWWHGQLP